MKQYRYKPFNGDYIKFKGGTLNDVEKTFDKADKTLLKYDDHPDMCISIYNEIHAFARQIDKEQKQILLDNYPVDEMAEILGYYEGEGYSAFDKNTHRKLLKLEKKSEDETSLVEWSEIILTEAVKNGNFAEVIKYGKFLPV